MVVAFVIIDYHGSADTAAYIGSARGCPLPTGMTRLFVVVENSGDGSQQAELLSIFSSQPDVHVIQNANPRGYLHGINFGLQWLCQKCEPDFCIAGNNDMLVDNADFFRELGALRVPSDVFVIAPQVRDAKGDYQNPCLEAPQSALRSRLFDLYYWRYSTFVVCRVLERLLFTAIRILHPLKDSRRDEQRQIYAAHGSVFILTRSFMEKVGTFWDCVALFGEEPIVAETVRRNGGRILFVPQLRLYHKTSQTLCRLPDRQRFLHVKRARQGVKDWMASLDEGKRRSIE